MEFKEQLLSDLKEAMKAKNSLKVDTLRFLNAEIKNREIDAKKALSEDEYLAILTSQIKKRKESVAMFEKGGRMDLKEKEEAEIAILSEYLPEQVDEDTIRARIKEVVAETGAQGPKEMGKVMKTVAPEFKGKADGNRIRELVQEALSS